PALAPGITQPRTPLRKRRPRLVPPRQADHVLRDLLDRFGVREGHIGPEHRLFIVAARRRAHPPHKVEVHRGPPPPLHLRPRPSPPHVERLIPPDIHQRR